MDGSDYPRLVSVRGEKWSKEDPVCPFIQMFFLTFLPYPSFFPLAFPSEVQK